MNNIDWKQIPNLEQVATLVFVSLGLTVTLLLFLSRLSLGLSSFAAIAG